MVRLHREGFSHAAIQRALADAGVNVSKSTVQRELARPLSRLPLTPRPPTTAAPLSQTMHQPGRPIPSQEHIAPHGGLPSEPRSPREIAEAFLKTQITNPLFKNRS